MKLLRLIISIVLTYWLLSLCGCSNTESDTDYRVKTLMSMQAPVVVISTSYSGGEMNILVKDSVGRMEILYCRCFASLNPGDRIK